MWLHHLIVAGSSTVFFFSRVVKLTSDICPHTATTARQLYCLFHALFNNYPLHPDSNAIKNCFWKFNRRIKQPQAPQSQQLNISHEAHKRKKVWQLKDSPSYLVGIVSGRWWSLLFYVTGETSLSRRILFQNTASCMETIPPVLNSPASLIDYIASYKLSMVHKLCSAEHNTAQCQPAGTRTFRAPASSLSALVEICLVNCAMRSLGLEKRQEKYCMEKSFKHAIPLWVSEWVSECAYQSTLRLWHSFTFYMKNIYL